MDIVDPGKPSQRSPQDAFEEFEELWAHSLQRAADRPGLTLEELKVYSSRIRRMAKLSVVRERDSGIRKSERFSWPGSSKRAG